MKKGRKLTIDGIPIDAKDWTETDWADLHHAVQKVITQVAQRHVKMRPEDWVEDRLAEIRSEGQRRRHAR